MSARDGAVNGVWPVGSFPPIILSGQVRTASVGLYVVVCSDDDGDLWDIAGAGWRAQNVPTADLLTEPLGAPWADPTHAPPPAPTPDAIAAAEARGYARCQADVVAHVLECVEEFIRMGDDSHYAMRALAERLRANEHLGAAKGGDPK